MKLFIIGLLIGLFVGAPLGLVISSVLIIAKDEWQEKNTKERDE